MTRYWIEPDADREPTLWVAESEEPALMDHSYPRAVARRCDTPAELWALALVLVGKTRSREALASDIRYVLERAVAAELVARKGLVR